MVEKDVKMPKEMILTVQHWFAGKNMQKLPTVTSVLTCMGSPNPPGVKVARISKVQPMPHDSFYPLDLDQVDKLPSNG